MVCHKYHNFEEILVDIENCIDPDIGGCAK